MTQEKKISKSVTTSCRLDKEVFDALNDEAKDKGLSLNSLIHSMLKKQIGWQRFSGDLGFVPLTKRTLRDIFNSLSDEKIEEISQNVGGIVPKELFFLQFENNNFEGMMKVLEINASRFGIVKHFSHETKHQFNIYHRINKKFSKFLVESHKTLVKELPLKLTIKDFDDNTVSIEFENLEEIKLNQD